MIKSGWTLLLLVALCACSDEDRLEPVPPVAPMPPAIFPLEISPDHRHLVDQAGKPFLIQGDSVWSLISGTTRSEAEDYLTDRVSRGFNTVLVEVMDHTEPVNGNGDAPFTTPGDFSTPNPDYFDHADWILGQAAARGMLVWLVPMYLGYAGGDEGFYADALAAGPAAMREWGRWVGQRYGGIDGLVWVIGGDYTPPPEGLELLAQVVAGIREFDTRHLFAAHWARESSGWEVSVPWIDVNTTYTAPPVYPQALEDRAGMEAPLVLIEAYYENEHNMTLDRVRAQAYQAILCGSTGQFFGNLPMWNFGAGWRDALHSDGSLSMTHLRNLFVGMDWSSLEPDTSATLLTAGRGTNGTEDYVTVGRDPAGHLAILHVPTPRTLELDLQSMAGAVELRWYDPTSGTFSPASAGAVPREIPLTLGPQSPNSVGDPDWILVLESN